MIMRPGKWLLMLLAVLMLGTAGLAAPGGVGFGQLMQAMAEQA